MADVALLVVEEFENRKRWTNEDGIEAINRVCLGYVSSLGKKVEDGVSLLKCEVEVVRGKASSALHQPRTSAGLAACDGFFSA